MRERSAPNHHRVAAGLPRPFDHWRDADSTGAVSSHAGQNLGTGCLRRRRARHHECSFTLPRKLPIGWTSAAQRPLPHSTGPQQLPVQAQHSGRKPARMMPTIALSAHTGPPLAPSHVSSLVSNSGTCVRRWVRRPREIPGDRITDRPNACAQSSSGVPRPGARAWRTGPRPARNEHFGAW